MDGAWPPRNCSTSASASRCMVRICCGGRDLLSRQAAAPAGSVLPSPITTASTFCATIPSTPPEKVLVQRLGVDRVLPWPHPARNSESAAERRRFCLLAVGRLHRVKDYRFLIQACATLRDQGLDFLCWIAGEGPERAALERQIAAAGLQERVVSDGTRVAQRPFQLLPSCRSCRSDQQE